MKTMFALMIIGGAAAMTEDKITDDLQSALYEGAGHKFHIRLAIDVKNKTVTATILDGKAKNAVPIAEKSIKLKTKDVKDLVVLDAKDAKDGKASTFRVAIEKLGGKHDFKAITLVAKLLANEESEFELEE
jgi:hypothetical protein